MNRLQSIGVRSLGLRSLGLRSLGAVRRAFTIIEILVVVTIITIIVLIALPRFATMLYAQEEQLAGNLLSVAMRTGRDAALRSSGDEDTAIVFFYRPFASNSSLGGRLVMVPCVKVGTFLDDPRRLTASVVVQSSEVQGIERDVFVPVEGVEPVVMPRNWMVRGYAPPNTIEPGIGTLDNRPADPRANWYEGNRYTDGEGNWVFPETDFYPPAEDRAGNARQTFMIRFKAGTGEVVTVPNTTVIVLDVRPYYDGRDPAGTRPLYEAYDKTAFIRKILREASRSRQFILGRDGSGATASDVVLTRPVSQLAVYDETKLAAALGVSVNSESGCLYQPPRAPRGPSSTTGPAVPTYVAGVDPIRINQWIEGDTNFNDRIEGADGADEPLARLFALDRYTGVPRQLEVQP